MHALAIDLMAAGHQVTGSDDVIFEPSRSRLEAAGLLPAAEGWDPARIHPGIDTVVLGMHAQLDNPELIQAQTLGLRIVSFPELISELSEDAHRTVIAGSHGKTTITAMITHVWQDLQQDFDYALGALIPGVASPVKVRAAKKILIEGDEYLSSRLDRRSKFLHYQPNILVITGIAWDHFNVFSTWQSYLDNFGKLLEGMQRGETVIFYGGDENVRSLVEERGSHLTTIEYHGLEYDSSSKSIHLDKNQASIQVFGDHNLQNMAAAWEVCRIHGISSEDFLSSIASFKGAHKRLQLVTDPAVTPQVYLDYAHAPSKVRATVHAVAQHYPSQRICAIYELHTYSSMDPDFLHQYSDTIGDSVVAAIFFDEEAAQIKRRAILSEAEIRKGFSRKDLTVLRSSQALHDYLQAEEHDVYLFMSSGNFGGFSVTEWASKV